MVGIYFAHFVSLGLYVLAIACGLMNLKKSDIIPQPLRRILIGYIIFAIATACTFIVLQVDWITNNRNNDVGDITSMWWLLFDYLNAIAYITGMVALGVGIDMYGILQNKLHTTELKRIASCYNFDCKERENIDSVEE